MDACDAWWKAWTVGSMDGGWHGHGHGAWAWMWCVGEDSGTDSGTDWGGRQGAGGWEQLVVRLVAGRMGGGRKGGGDGRQRVVACGWEAGRRWVGRTCEGGQGA